MLKPQVSRPKRIVGVKATLLPAHEQAKGAGYVIWAYEKNHSRHDWLKSIEQLNEPDRVRALQREVTGSTWGNDTIIYTPIYEEPCNEWGEVSL